jgi:hypothetical protein
MSTVGTFTLIKNEIAWIKAHLMSWLPHVDKMVFFDGNSTDGTLEVLRYFSKHHKDGWEKIQLVENVDPKNLQEEYVRLFNECLQYLNTNYAIFAHPDMILDDPGNIHSLGEGIAYYSNCRSFAGDPGGQLYEITTGRTDKWKHIYRHHNPSLGLHYFGFYGARNEDCYFRAITEDEHRLHEDWSEYPYEIPDSGMRILHYSDVRLYERRHSRMVKCLLNDNNLLATAEAVATNHPRVTLKNGYGFKFVPSEYHPLLREPCRV